MIIRLKKMLSVSITNTFILKFMKIGSAGYTEKYGLLILVHMMRIFFYVSFAYRQSLVTAHPASLDAWSQTWQCAIYV